MIAVHWYTEITRCPDFPLFAPICSSYPCRCDYTICARSFCGRMGMLTYKYMEPILIKLCKKLRYNEAPVSS